MMCAKFSETCCLEIEFTSVQNSFVFFSSTSLCVFFDAGDLSSRKEYLFLALLSTLHASIPKDILFPV